MSRVPLSLWLLVPLNLKVLVIVLVHLYQPCNFRCCRKEAFSWRNMRQVDISCRNMVIEWDWLLILISRSLCSLLVWNFSLFVEIQKFLPVVSNPIRTNIHTTWSSKTNIWTFIELLRRGEPFFYLRRDVRPKTFWSLEKVPLIWLLEIYHVRHPKGFIMEQRNQITSFVP